jgi:hypothetical protein
VRIKVKGLEKYPPRAGALSSAGRSVQLTQCWDISELPHISPHLTHSPSNFEVCQAAGSLPIVKMKKELQRGWVNWKDQAAS